MLIALAQDMENIERMLQIMEYMDKVQKVMKLKKIPHKSAILIVLRRIPEH